MPYMITDDFVSLFYKVKGTGLPVVFIHPFVMGHNVFRHQEQLAAGYQTIFYDIRGHGQSEKGNQPITISLLAEDLKQLLDHMGIKKAAVCGYSHGGLVAQEFALKYPDRTSALLLSGGYSELNNFTPIAFIKSVMFLAKIRQMSVVAKLQAKLNKHYPEDEPAIFNYARRSDPERSYEYCQAGLRYNSTASLYRLKMPVLLVYGSLEKPMHHYRIPFEQSAPHTKVIFIEGGTHQVPPQSFQKFNAAVDRFLQPIAQSYGKKQAGGRE